MNDDLMNLAAAADDDTFDDHRNLPKPDQACLYGLIGEAAEAGSEGTEANRFAIAANLIAYLSSGIGRAPYLLVGDTKHHAHLFFLHVGRSGLGRKGDSAALSRRIDEALQKLDPRAAPKIHSGGLSTKEGLIALIPDPYGEGEDAVAGVDDKRLLVRESEFANVLQQRLRSGNTLSTALRDAWDGVDMKPATRTRPVGVTEPHISLSAAVTPGELRALLGKQDLTNGFANRFLIFWAERDGKKAFPTPTARETVDYLAQEFKLVIEYCLGHCIGQNDTMLMTFSPDAALLYSKLYKGELEDRTHGERINALLERRAPMLLRLAMIFTLTDRKTIIEVKHINAALAWVRYYVDTVKFIFASGADEARSADVQEAAEKIIAHLAIHGQVTRTQLSRDCFSGHLTSDFLNEALDELLQTNPPRIQVHQSGGKKAGRAAKYYSLTAAGTANSADLANSLTNQHIDDTSPDGEQCGIGEINQSELEQVRELRNSSQDVSAPVILEGSAIPQNSPTPQMYEHIVSEEL